MIDARMPSLPSATRALLRQERLLPAADDALRRRVLERARGLLEDRPSGVSLRLSSSKSPTRTRSRWIRSALPVAAALALAGLAAASVGLDGVSELLPPVQRKALLSLPEPSVPSRLAMARGPAPAPLPTPLVVDASVPPRPSSGAPEPARPSSTYALELRLLEPARSSLARGDFTAALAAVARHQRQYPQGQLAEEREALRVRALWGAGTRSEAERAAALFRKRYPHSGLVGWMKTVPR